MPSAGLHSHDERPLTVAAPANPLASTIALGIMRIRVLAHRAKYLWRVERWQFQRRGDSQVGLTDPTVRIDLDIGRPLAHVLSAASTLSSRAVGVCRLANLIMLFQHARSMNAMSC